jgi:hypothetical protein
LFDVFEEFFALFFGKDAGEIAEGVSFCGLLLFEGLKIGVFSDDGFPFPDGNNDSGMFAGIVR